MGLTISEGKVHINTQFRYSNVGSEMKSFSENQGLRRKLKRVFTDITITVQWGKQGERLSSLTRGKF